MLAASLLFAAVIMPPRRIQKIVLLRNQLNLSYPFHPVLSNSPISRSSALAKTLCENRSYIAFSALSERAVARSTHSTSFFRHEVQFMHDTRLKFIALTSYGNGTLTHIDDDLAPSPHLRSLRISLTPIGL